MVGFQPLAGGAAPDPITDRIAFNAKSKGGTVDITKYIKRSIERKGRKPLFRERADICAEKQQILNESGEKESEKKGLL